MKVSYWDSHSIPTNATLPGPPWRQSAIKRERYAQVNSWKSQPSPSGQIFDAIQQDCGVPLHQLKVDGGMTNSDEFMQIQSDILNATVHRPLMRETTALGAALAAGIGVGIWKSEHDIVLEVSFDVFDPTNGLLVVENLSC